MACLLLGWVGAGMDINREQGASAHWFTGGEAPGVSAASCFLWVRRGARMLGDEKQVGYFSCNSLPSEMSFHVFPWN